MVRHDKIIYSAAVLLGLLILVIFGTHLTLGNNRISQNVAKAFDVNQKLKAFSLRCNELKKDKDPVETVQGSGYKREHQSFNKGDKKWHYETVTFTNKATKSSKAASEEKDNEHFLKFNYGSEVVILSSIIDQNSFGNEKDRSFKSFLQTLTDINYPKSKVNLGFFVQSKIEFETIKLFTSQYYEAQGLPDWLEALDLEKFGKITVLRAPFVERLKIDRNNRHDESLQRKRRSVIAKVRNFLLNTVVGNEKYSLFVDSDVIEIPGDLVNYFIKSGKDILVPRVVQGNCKDYDQNSWQGKRIQPTPEEFQRLTDDPKYIYVPRRSKQLNLLLDLSRGIPENSEEAFNYLTPIDSVGGAVLFVKNEIFKQGIQFPPLYIVGTDFKRREGYDGIETEGLCYQAQAYGYQCYGAPDVTVQHYDS